MSTAVRGRVVDDTGAPVRTFKIRSHPANENRVQHYRRRDHPTEGELSFTGDTGAFEIPSLEPGEWILTAHGSGDSRSIPKPVTVPNGSGDLTLVLPREATIKGTVHRPDGEALAGADIFVESDDDHPLHPEPRGRSGRDGAFQLDGILPGRVALHASHPEYCDSDETEVDGPPGTSTAVQLRLTRGGRITGRVDASQDPVSHRLINLYSHRGTIGWRNGESDASGAFEFNHVIPQEYIVELRTPDDGRRSAIRKTITVKAGETVQVVLGEPRPSIDIAGRVVSGETPVANVELRIGPKDEAEEDRGGVVRTDDQGRFSGSVLGPGAYVFTVNNEFMVERKVEPQEELMLQVPAGAVSATVLSADGKPVERAGVTLFRQDGTQEFWKRYRRTKTLEDGSFEFRFLEPGSYALRVPEGFQGDRPPPRTPYGRRVIGLTVGDQPLKKRGIMLPPEGRLSGQVVDALGRPCVAWIMVLNEKGIQQSADWETHSDAMGWFEVTSLAPGTYTLTVQGEKIRVNSEPVKVEAGRTAELTIRLG